MTLDEIVTYTSSKLGITHAAARAQARLFAQMRHRMLWNEQNFRQTRHQATVPVNAGTQDVTLPAEFEFVTGCRWAGRYELLGVSDLGALAANPGGYDAAGPVLAFVPLGKDAAGNAIIRLMQVPQSAGALLVIGKRKCVELVNGTDSPLIPGEDQVLCEFVMADLYEWLRQFGKAQAFLQRAAILLQKMVEIETQQTAEVRRLIPIEQQMDDDTSGDWLRG
jgi:hypothetical protein